MSRTKTRTNSIKHKNLILEPIIDKLVQDTGELTNTAVTTVNTIADLHNITPTVAGEVYYVKSSVAHPEALQGYLGGGLFVSYDNTQANTDDGGVFVNSPHPTLDFKRTGFTEFDLRFWGLVENIASVDNAPYITNATAFAKKFKVILKAPSGNIYTSEMYPLYEYTGLVGEGCREATIFYKTTNNAFPYKANGNTAFTVDALVGFIPKVAVNGGSLTNGDTVAHGITLSKVMFRREGLTEANYATTRPEVGLLLGSCAACTVSDVVVEGAYIGTKGWICYLSTIERLFHNNYAGKGFTGFTLSSYSAPPVGAKTSGTSLDMRIVSSRGYQVGFEFLGHQYTNLTCCTVEDCKPMEGETNAIAFSFINPYSITMDSCATEVVHGTQISARNMNPVSYKSSLVITNFMAISQMNPVTPNTPMFNFDNGRLGTLNVTMIGGDCTRNSALANLSNGIVSGTGAKVTSINCGGLAMVAQGGGVYNAL